MSDLPTEIIEPVSASADGKRNSYTLFCEFTATSMNYAACLWRQGVLEKSGIKTPADWTPCSQARDCNRCTAVNMRQEEELSGKAIYFQDRNLVRKFTDAVTRWTRPASMPGMSTTVRPTPVKSMLDAMGDTGSMSDVVSAVAATHVATPRPAPVTPTVIHVALPGESPLQMARRIARERAEQC